MGLQSVPLLSFDFFPSRPVQIEISPAPLTTDAGLLPIRQFDDVIRLTEQFAAAIEDRRDPKFIEQPLLTMVRQRIFGILADYEDQNDHDTLRSDPVFKVIADRLPDDPDLSSQPTLSRFENAVSIPDLWRLRDVLVNLFIQSFDTPPGHITLDLDAFDDPAHGDQQLIMFHGYYEQYQYLPIVITCAENDMVLLVGLRHGTCAATLGVDNDLRYLVGKLRAVWPDVHIHVRADSGFGVPLMYNVCQELRLSYTFGLGMNSVLRDLSEELLKQAVEDFEQTKKPQRLFLAVRYQAGSWTAAQPIVIKVEAHAQGINRRAVVTNRPGWGVLPCSGVRRIRRAGREREPQQRAEAGAASRSPERPSVHGQLLPIISSCGCVELAGAAPTCRRLAASDDRRTGTASRVAGRGDRCTASQAILQQATGTRPTGRRIRLHVAHSPDQSRRGDHHSRSTRDRAAVGELAAPGPLLGGQPSCCPSAANPLLSVSLACLGVARGQE